MAEEFQSGNPHKYSLKNIPISILLPLLALLMLLVPYILGYGALTARVGHLEQAQVNTHYKLDALNQQATENGKVLVRVDTSLNNMKDQMIELKMDMHPGGK